MAKEKKKKIKITNMALSQNELQPTTIGVFENRKKSSIGVFILLTTFILVIIFLPEISEYVNAYLNPTAPTPSVTPGTNPNKPGTPDDNENYAEVFYDFNESLKITRVDIAVGDFVLNPLTNTLDFTVTNKLNTYKAPEELNYYLELYNSEQTLLERLKITGDFALASNAFQKYTKSISAQSATTLRYVVLVQKTTNDYPQVVLSNDGTDNIVCSSNHEKVTYKFNTNKLKEVTGEYTYNETDIGYLENLQNNKILSNTYNNKTGITSTFFEYVGGYNITTSVNLSEASRQYVFNADTFKLDTEPKVVKFEMEAQGFTCE